MKKYLFTVLFIAIPLLAHAQLRVGIMNPETVLDALPETAQIQTDMQAFTQQRDQQFQSQYQVWVDDYTAFQEQQSTLSEEQRNQRMQSLVSRQEELQELEQQLQSQIETRWNELFNPIMDRVDSAVETVATDMELDFIFNEVTAQGDPLVYFASERIFNITDQVIETVTNN